MTIQRPTCTNMNTNRWVSVSQSQSGWREMILCVYFNLKLPKDFFPAEKLSGENITVRLAKKRGMKTCFSARCIAQKCRDYFFAGEATSLQGFSDEQETNLNSVLRNSCWIFLLKFLPRQPLMTDFNKACANRLKHRICEVHDKRMRVPVPKQQM